MEVYTKEEFQIFIIGNYLSNYYGDEDTVFDHSSYYGVYKVEAKLLKLLQEKSQVELMTYYNELTFGYFVDILIASHRIHYLNNVCTKGGLHSKGYSLIGNRYFVPRHMHKFDYFVNRMLHAVDSLKVRWKYEYEPLLKKMRTPEQIRQDVTVSRMAYGVEDYDESQTAGMIAMVKRADVYSYLINSYYAQFIHLIGSIIEDSFIRGLKDKGTDINKFDRNILYNFVYKKTGEKYEKIENSHKYSKFIVLWNFLKHNNKTAFDEVRKICPEYLMHDEDFLEYGHSSQNYLKISKDLIIELLDGLKDFFISFSMFVFNENHEESQWNYFDYFVNEAYDTYKWHLMPN